MPFIGAEAGAAAVTAWLASAIVAAYVADRLGFAIAPLPVLLASLSSSAAVWLSFRRRTARDRTAFAVFSTAVAATFAWLMWRARPDFLPAGTGSDLAHHLSLLRYLEVHGRLVHDAVAGAYLGEMIDYTPGAHLLIVLAGRWLRTDGLHVAHAVVSATVALKIGIVFLIARRLMPDDGPRVPFAIAAALLPWLPYRFFAGSFMEQSFLSQVVSELFAMAMWWTIVVWNERPSPRMMALFALFGTAAFLTWPIWIGPLVLTLAVVVLRRRGVDWRLRLRHLTIALAPIAVVTAIYAAGRQVYGFAMVHAVGYAMWPTPATLGWTFTLLAAAGLAWSATDRRARGAAILCAAIALQAAVLIVTGSNSGATSPYLSLKMWYLAIYPLSVAAAAAIAYVWRAAIPRAAPAR
jgi:hypothetical protein